MDTLPPPRRQGAADHGPRHPGTAAAQPTTPEAELFEQPIGPATTGTPAAQPTTPEALSTEPLTIGVVRPLREPVLPHPVLLRTPEISADGIRCGDYRVAAASLTGLDHLSDGVPRQDAYDFMPTRCGRLVVAVADGLGSRERSQIGARLFTEQVTRLAAEEIGTGDWTAVDYLIRGAEQTQAIAGAVYRQRPDDVLFVAAVAVFDTHGASISRVGDVTAFARIDDDEFVELFPFNPEPGTPDHIVTATLPGPSRPEVTDLPYPYDRIALATDGLAKDLRTSPGVYHWLADRWTTPLTARAMTHSLSYRRQTSHDDRTAVVIWRTGHPTPPLV